MRGSPPVYSAPTNTAIASPSHGGRAPDRAGRLLRLLRSLRRDERGQMLALTTLALLSMLGIAALVLDFGLFFTEQRKLQNAADGAALAAARELPDDPVAAALLATQFLDLNGYTTADPDLTVVLSNSGPDLKQFEVVLTQSTPFLFGRVLGFTLQDIRVSAEAEIVTSFGDGYAIFVISNDCNDVLDIQGTEGGFIGIVHSNSDMAVGGSDHDFDPAATYRCDMSVGGTGHEFEAGVKRTGERESPLSYDLNSFGLCTFTFVQGNVNLKSQGAIWADPQKTQLLPGVYCFNGSMRLIGDDITGNVTFVAAGNVTISGSDHVLTAFHQSGILVYSDSSSVQAINASGSGGTWTGTLYAPNGHLDVSGQSNHDINGSLVADTVSVNGNGLTVTAPSGTANGNPVVRLIR